MKKKKSAKIIPSFIKNARGQTTHVRISYDAYQCILERLREYDKLKKKKKGIWVTVKDIQEDMRKREKN